VTATQTLESSSFNSATFVGRLPLAGRALIARSFTCGPAVLSALFMALAGAEVAGAADVIYQLPAGGGATVSLTLQNYVAGTALVNSDFVGLSFVDPNVFGGLSFTINPTQLGSLNGVVNPSNPTQDVVFLTPRSDVVGLVSPQILDYELSGFHESNASVSPDQWDVNAVPGCVFNPPRDRCVQLPQGQGRPHALAMFNLGTTTTAAVPEPDALMLLLVGLSACGGYWWLRRERDNLTRALRTRACTSP
jgi:hypothetical protein